jgi:hypothetical protein
MAEPQRRLRLTAKEQALQDLENARNSLGEQLSQAAAEFSPRTAVRRSLENHRWLWVGSAVFAGLLIVRLIVPAGRKIRRDNTGPSATKSGLIALFLAPMLGMVRRVALNYATTHAKTYLHQYLSRHGAPGPRP